MHCKFCGKELAEGAVFCPDCGKGVNETATNKVDVLEIVKKYFNYNTLSLIVGTFIIIIGIVRLGDSSYGISSTSFGADFYTYAYRGIVGAVKMLGRLNETISWVLIALGLYIDLKAVKGFFKK